MPRERTQLERRIGILISVCQKEWHEKMGEDAAETSMDVVDAGHSLLQAAKNGSLHETLGGKTIAEFIGQEWISKHLSVRVSVDSVEELVAHGQHT